MVISKLRINLGYKTFFNMNFILTYNMYMYVPPVRNWQRCTAPQNRFKIAVQLNYSCLAAF